VVPTTSEVKLFFNEKAEKLLEKLYEPKLIKPCDDFAHKQRKGRQS